jgi:WD40 repeat protein
MSVDFSADGKWIAAGRWNKKVQVWNAATGKLVRKFVGHEGNVSSVAFTPDGRLVTGSWDRTIRVWDLLTGETLKEYTGHRGQIRSLSVSHDGRRIVSGCSDATGLVWELPPSR